MLQDLLNSHLHCPSTGEILIVIAILLLFGPSACRCGGLLGPPSDEHGGRHCGNCGDIKK